MLRSAFPPALVTDPMLANQDSLSVVRPGRSYQIEHSNGDNSYRIDRNTDSNNHLRIKTTILKCLTTC